MKNVTLDVTDLFASTTSGQGVYTSAIIAGLERAQDKLKKKGATHIKLRSGAGLYGTKLWLEGKRKDAS